MPAKRIYQNIKELIHHYLNNYYKEVEERPSIRQDTDRHTKMILHINYDYQEALKVRAEQFPFEEHKNKFLEAIELRTQFQQKAREVQEKKERNKALFEKVKK
jgi:hypothetical protein